VTLEDFFRSECHSRDCYPTCYPGIDAKVEMLELSATFGSQQISLNEILISPTWNRGYMRQQAAAGT